MISNKTSPLVSVVVPVYHTEDYLEKCVNSIISQTYTNLEIVIIDDGDDGLALLLCDELSLRDERIKVLHQKNQGLSAARNKGVELSTGEYITFIDSDDYITDGFVEMLVSALIEKDADISVGGIRIKRRSTKEWLVSPPKEDKLLVGDDLIIEFIENNLSSTSVCGKLFKKTIIENEKMLINCFYEDGEVLPRWAVNAENGAVFASSKKEWYCYCQDNDNSITKSEYTEKKLRDHYYLAHKTIEYCSHINDKVLDAAIHDWIRIGIYILRQSRGNKQLLIQRDSIRNEVLDTVSNNPQVKLSYKEKITCFIMNIGIKTFDLCFALRDR